MRNAEKDAREMKGRRDLMLETGFRVFAKKGIEGVTLQEVADACGIGIATLYRYFSTKLAFVIEIGTRKWNEYYKEVEAEFSRRGGDKMNAAEELDFYLSSYIVLYREHRDILAFNQNFNSYIIHEAATPAQLRDYMNAIEAFSVKFHKMYEKGRIDGSIATDEPERSMFVSTMHIMLAVAARFAQGVVYSDGNKADLTGELLNLKRMIMAQYVRAK